MPWHGDLALRITAIPKNQRALLSTRARLSREQKKKQMGSAGIMSAKQMGSLKQAGLFLQDSAGARGERARGEGAPPRQHRGAVPAGIAGIFRRGFGGWRGAGGEAGEREYQGLACSVCASVGNCGPFVGRAEVIEHGSH